MIQKLQGREHQVYTGVTVILCMENGELHGTSFAERTNVELWPMTEDEISTYAQSGEPLDKAGAYGIQGSFAAYIKGIQGDYTNVVGLPLGRLVHEMNTLLTENGEHRMIKLIVSDVDGTLVEDGSADINPELFEVILKLRERGFSLP